MKLRILYTPFFILDAWLLPLQQTRSKVANAEPRVFPQDRRWPFLYTLACSRLVGQSRWADWGKLFALLVVSCLPIRDWQEAAGAWSRKRLGDLPACDSVKWSDKAFRDGKYRNIALFFLSLQYVYNNREFHIWTATARFLWFFVEGEGWSFLSHFLISRRNCGESVCNLQAAESSK